MRTGVACESHAVLRGVEIATSWIGAVATADGTRMAAMTSAASTQALIMTLPDRAMTDETTVRVRTPQLGSHTASSS